MKRTETVYTVYNIFSRRGSSKEWRWWSGYYTTPRAARAQIRADERSYPALKFRIVREDIKRTVVR